MYLKNGLIVAYCKVKLGNITMIVKNQRNQVIFTQFILQLHAKKFRAIYCRIAILKSTLSYVEQNIQHL